MKKTACYIRVSTDRQVQEGDSVQAQQSALQKYIKEHSGLVFAGEYVDDGVSGTKFAERDELQRMLADVRQKKIDLIIFTKLDRFYRSIRHYTATQEILDKYGVGWIAVWEPVYDTTTPQGRLIVNQMMSIAQFEAENTSQRIKQVFDYKRQKGEVLSGNAPVGYKIENKHLVIVPEEAERVRFAFETYRETSNLGETIRRTCGTGLPTGKQSFKKLLRNRTYIGSHNGKDDFCEPIINKELFDEVQRLLKINYKSGVKKHEYIFSGLLKCGSCGKNMGGVATQYSRSRYRCNTYYNEGGGCSNNHSISEAAIEDFLISNLRELIGEELRPRDYEIKEGQKDYSTAIAGLKQKRDRLKELYINGFIEMDEYRAEREKYTAEIAGLEARTGPKKDQTALKELLKLDIVSIYRTLEKAEKRRFWRSFVEKIVFMPGEPLRVFFL